MLSNEVKYRKKKKLYLFDSIELALTSLIFGKG